MGTISANQRPVCEVTDQSEARAIMIVMRHDPSHSSQYDPCFASPGSVTRGKNSRDFVSRDIVCEARPDPGDIRVRVVLVPGQTIHDCYNGQYSE